MAIDIGSTLTSFGQIPGFQSTQPIPECESGVNGIIEHDGDTDLYRVYLKRGYKYRIYITGIDAYGPRLNDPFLSIRNTEGMVTASNNDNNEPGFRDSTPLDPLIDFDPPSDGFYFLEAQGFGGGS